MPNIIGFLFARALANMSYYQYLISVPTIGIFNFYGKNMAKHRYQVGVKIKIELTLL